MLHTFLNHLTSIVYQKWWWYIWVTSNTHNDLNFLVFPNNTCTMWHKQVKFDVGQDKFIFLIESNYSLRKKTILNIIKKTTTHVYQCLEKNCTVINLVCQHVSARCSNTVCLQLCNGCDNFYTRFLSKLSSVLTFSLLDSKAWILCWEIGSWTSVM